MAETNQRHGLGATSLFFLPPQISEYYYSRSLKVPLMRYLAPPVGNEEKTSKREQGDLQNVRVRT